MHIYDIKKYLFTLFLAIQICINANLVFASAQIWTELESGLNYTEIKNPKAKNEYIYILSFDPKLFQFNVYSISEKKHRALSLKQWAKQENLVAAINASMYLPDNMTSTGYMRNKEHFNNDHIAKNFGAFMVSKPLGKDGATLPHTDIIDKDHANWQELIQKYEVVVQNYRLINSKKEILWRNSAPLFSISAIGKDDAGNILLIHSSYAITPYKFAQLLLLAGLNINTVMYTEGGHQAGLLIDVPKLTKAWHGNSFVDFLIPSKISPLLPNIVGITRREPEASSAD